MTAVQWAGVVFVAAGVATIAGLFVASILDSRRRDRDRGAW